MAITGLADVAEVIEKVVSTMTTETLIQESVGMGAVRDFSSMVGPGMDRLDIPLFNELAVQTVDDAGGAMTPQTIDPEAAQLSLNSHRSVPFSIPKRVGLQSKLNLVQEALKNAPRSLAAEIDDSIFTEAIAGAGTTVAVAAADALAAILDCKQQLDTDNVRRTDRFLVGSPAFIADLLGTNNIIRANEYGASAPIQAGMVASIYGFMILESSSSSVPTDGFIAMHREGMAFARQREVQFERELKVLEQREDYALTHLYGVKHTVLAAASNPRIYVYNP